MYTVYIIYEYVYIYDVYIQYMRPSPASRASRRKLLRSPSHQSREFLSPHLHRLRCSSWSPVDRAPVRARVQLRYKRRLPSGKLTVCYGKSPFLMGKLTINGHFQ